MVKELTLRIPCTELLVRLSVTRRRAETTGFREYRIASRAETAELRAALLRRIANGRKG